MTYYRPDPKLQDAKAIMEETQLSPREELLVYYIKDQQSLIEEYQKRIGEYCDFFTQLSRFLPSSNPIFR